MKWHEVEMFGEDVRQQGYVVFKGCKNNMLETYGMM